MDLAPLIRRFAIPAALLTPACWAAETDCAGRCGTAVVVTTVEPTVLLPPLVRNDVDLEIADQLFLRLATPGPTAGAASDAGYEPALAASWTATDSVTLTFQLDPAARWHDGTPVTAADVVFTHDLYTDPLVAASSAPQLARITAVEAPDRHTVVMRFREAYFEQFFDATQHMRILPRHQLDTVPRGTLAGHPLARRPLGAGPYRLHRWQPGELVELEADTAYFRGRPGIARLIWRIVPDRASAVAQVLAGEADIMARLPGPEDVDRAAAADHLRLYDYPSITYGYISLNLRVPGDRSRPHPLLANAALRRALLYATDRRAIVASAMGGQARIPSGPLAPTVWAWADTLTQPPHDSVRAAALLDSLGWRDTDGDGVRDRGGQPLALDLLVPVESRTRNRGAVILQDQWRRLGIALDINALEFGTFSSRFDAGRFTAAFASRFVDPTPAGLLEFWTTGAITRGRNAEGYASPVFDSLAAAASTARSLPRARALWHEAIAVLNADVPGIWVYSPVYVLAAHHRITGVRVVPGRWATTLWTWQIPEDRALARDRVAAR